MVNLTTQDIEELLTAVDEVEISRQEGAPNTTNVDLSCGSAKVYHMGINNPVVRVDFKFK